MLGLQLTADLAGCDPMLAAMTDVDALRQACLQATAAAGLTVVGERFHAFGQGSGVTGVLLLAESHLAVHTWPEFAQVTIDVFVCNLRGDNDARAETALQALLPAFGARHVTRQGLRRGPDTVAPAPA